jgi:hypothetical protein
MQSLNEELQTVNAEQQSKMDELSSLNNDMRNLLNSTQIVTVFLDNELQAAFRYCQQPALSGDDRRSANGVTRRQGT